MSSSVLGFRLPCEKLVSLFPSGFTRVSGESGAELAAPSCLGWKPDVRVHFTPQPLLQKAHTSFIFNLSFLLCELKRSAN